MGAFFGVSALLFVASAALTIAWCESMSAMGEMPMPGDWTRSAIDPHRASLGVRLRRIDG